MCRPVQANIKRLLRELPGPCPLCRVAKTAKLGCLGAERSDQSQETYVCAARRVIQHEFLHHLVRRFFSHTPLHFSKALRRCKHLTPLAEPTRSRAKAYELSMSLLPTELAQTRFLDLKALRAFAQYTYFIFNRSYRVHSAIRSHCLDCRYAIVNTKILVFLCSIPARSIIRGGVCEFPHHCCLQICDQISNHLNDG